MSRQSSLPPPERVAQVCDDLLFVPTPDQRQVKAAFWQRYSQSPVLDISKITGTYVHKLVPDSRIPRWWSMFGFKEWFLNEDEFRQRLEYLANLSLDTLEAILTDPDANHSARVNAAKLIFEASNKMPKKWEKVAYLDAGVQNMDQAQLESFIRKQSLGLLAQPSEPDESAE